MFRFTRWRRCCFSVPRSHTTVRTLIAAAVIPRFPPSSAPREAPTPLVFVTTSDLDPNSTKEVTTLSSMLTEKGFSGLQVDLTRADADGKDSEGLVRGMSEELRSVIKLSANPFAPVIIARSASCLVGQKYISSYPATALILISPPISNANVEETRLPEPIEEFKYEPKFPIAIIDSDTPENVVRQKEGNRLCKDHSVFVDVIPVEGLEGQTLLNAVDLWLDELGI